MGEEVYRGHWDPHLHPTSLLPGRGSSPEEEAARLGFQGAHVQEAVACMNMPGSLFLSLPLRRPK